MKKTSLFLMLLLCFASTAFGNTPAEEAFIRLNENYHAGLSAQELAMDIQEDLQAANLSYQEVIQAALERGWVNPLAYNELKERVAIGEFDQLDLSEINSSDLAAFANLLAGPSGAGCHYCRHRRANVIMIVPPVVVMIVLLGGGFIVVGV